MYDDVDAAIRPDLAERNTRIREEQGITQRLFALGEVINGRPNIPFVDGAPDPKCYSAWRNAFLGACDAICEIAESSVNWAAEDRVSNA